MSWVGILPANLWSRCVATPVCSDSGRPQVGRFGEAVEVRYDGGRVSAWRARMESSHSPVECTTLLRWSPLTGTEGSNPSDSAS